MKQKTEQQVQKEMIVHLAKGKDMDWLIAEYCDQGNSNLNLNKSQR
jgi:hypothetical protein